MDLHPPRKEVMLWIFITLKNWSSSAGFEHANLGSNGKHDNHYTTKNKFLFNSIHYTIKMFMMAQKTFLVNSNEVFTVLDMQLQWTVLRHKITYVWEKTKGTKFILEKYPEDKDTGQH
jgi:hypothetical protein